MKSANMSDRFDSGNSPCAVSHRVLGTASAVFPTRSIAAGLACLILWVGAASVCVGKESEKKTSSKSDPGLGKLSQQVNDPEAYMRELSGRLNSSGGQKLLTRGMPTQGWRPSTPQTTAADSAAGTLPPPENRVTAQTPTSGAGSSGLSPVPTQTRFGWSPGANGSTGSATGSGAGATSQTWMSPSDRARQIDPLAALRETRGSETAQPAPAETAPNPQSWATPAAQPSQQALDGTRLLGQEPAPAVDARTWMAPDERTSQPSLDGARLLRASPRSTKKEPWQYATPPQAPQDQMMQTAPNGTAMSAQNPYAAQPTPQQWPAPTAQPWQAPQNQTTQTVPNGTATPTENPYATQATPQQWPAPTGQPWQMPQNQTIQTVPNGTAMPAQNPYALQATPPQWPNQTAPAVPSPDNQTAQMAQGELETIYPAGQSPWPVAAQTAPATPPQAAWDSPPGQAIAQDPRMTTAYAQAESMPTPSQSDLTQTWLSSKNRAAQTALNEIGALNKPQSAQATPTMPVTPATPVVTPEMGPTQGSQAARTVVNGSQARHFYEEKEPAWSLGADLNKYRAHAVQEGSRESGESLKKALGGIGLAIEDTTNILTLGYASDRAKPFRTNDGKGFFDDPGRVPQQAGTTLGSLGDGLYSIADLVTFNALPDSQKDVYLDNNPIVRPMIFTGRTIGGAWKTTEEIGNALTWGYFDNVTGSIGMCIESLIEALKHTGQAVTNLARVPVRLITGNSEKADKALDWVLLVPLEMASNAVQMKGISNMDDYKTAFADKGVIGSILEFGGSTFIVYRAVDEMLDELKSDNKDSSGRNGSSNPGDPEIPADVVDPPSGPGIIFWFEEGWPVE